MTYENLLYDVENGVATITLNRAETYNSLSLATIAELNDAMKSIARDKAVRAVILTGSGKGFSSGADLVELGGQVESVPISDVLRSGLNTLATRMQSLEKPIVAAINGVAAGAGTSLDASTSGPALTSSRPAHITLRR